MKKEMTISLAILPIFVLILAAAFSIFVWEAGMHFPLIIGIIAASIVAMITGFKWEDVQQMMVKGVSMALPAVFILLIIGTIVGSWIASGVIPTIIYYGLSAIHPGIFVPIVALVTGIVAVTLGSSFTAIATVGLAFMAIGQGLDFPPGLIAGAIISGAFFGDKLSPLSDTTNIAPAMAETDLFSHIKHMLWDTLPAFFIAILLYWIVSNTSSISGTADAQTIEEIITGLNSHFAIHPLLLVVPLITIALMMMRVPAVPALTGVGFLGAVLAVILQGESVSSIITIMTDGYSGNSGVAALDSLLSRGGLTSMLGTVALVILATSLGGVLEKSGAFDVLTRKMMATVRSTGSLISSSILSTFFVSFASGAQYLAIILPARTFVNKYKEMGIDTKNLSRAVESAGTVGINLVPWGVPAIFISGMYGLDPIEFIPFAFFAFLVPLINIVFGFTGWTIARKNYRHETTSTAEEEIA
ncbi:transporter, NhaC family [Oceanobacillus limi]|uniref:Transporter, NhaC family n=1 Tax=Oceanobacillus limi TaxID=930131 RepID=A0A1I0FKL1_9BACI|nr:Na+/H+ antiporter NhaC [Oceanobacillus limi]SET58008.1 transporter, NhaC family [Oceanobacillus limi]